MGKILFIDAFTLILCWIFWGGEITLIVLILLVPLSIVAMIAYAALEDVTQKDCGHFAQALGTRHYNE